MRSSGRIALGLVLVAATTVAATGRITVARQATVPGPLIRLGDVATLEGAEAEALADVTLGAAPAAGESRTLEGRSVLAMLRREQVDLDEVLYTIPATVRVRRATQEVDASAVRAILEHFLVETLGADADRAVLRAVEIPGPVHLPMGEYSARVVPSVMTQLLGRVRLRIEFAIDDRPVKTVWVTAHIGLYADVVVPRRPLGRGETIAAGDVTVDRRDLAELPRGVLLDAGDAVGMIVRTPLTPFTPIRPEQVEAPAAVHRGDVVLLVAERGALRITAPGEVRQDGGAGDQVRVVNRSTGKDLVGRVLDPSTVVVEF